MSSGSKRVSLKRNTLVIALCFIVMSLNASENENADKLRKMRPCETIYFRIDEPVIDVTYLDNKNKIAETRRLFDKIFNDDNIVVDSITIKASASPDGYREKNEILAKQRAKSLKELILTMIPEGNENLIRTSATVGDWEALTDTIQNDPNIDNKAEILAIIQSKLSDNEKREKLKTLNSGKTYTYLAKSILPQYRDANYCLVWYKYLTPPPEIIEVTDDEEIIPLEPFPVPELELEPEPVPLLKQKQMAIKTNLLFWAATVPNLGFEYPIGDKWSIDVPVYYMPFLLTRKYRIEVLGTQPELRYWFGKPLDGFYVGLHGHVAWYTVSFNNEKRFQDKDGNSPLWGGGLGFGYSKSLSDVWALEFAVGGGYAHIEYDIFRNYLNGPKYDTGTKNYWGLTRAGITLVYKINLQKR